MSAPGKIVIGNCELWCADCYEILDELTADVLLSDPPYGISYDATKDRSNRKSTLRGSKPQQTYWPGNIHGDDQSFDPRPFLQFSQVILWGAQHFSALLPTNPAWLIWDKRDGSRSDDFGDCEIAWTNLRGVNRLHRQLWRGLCRAGENNPVYGPKLHPAQKPIELMRWCVEKTTGIVLDPFAGSFTTALACLELDRPCIAIEIDPYYWEVGCHRLEEAYKQVRLFTPIPPPLRQEALL